MGKINQAVALRICNKKTLNKYWMSNNYSTVPTYITICKRPEPEKHASILALHDFNFWKIFKHTYPFYHFLTICSQAFPLNSRTHNLTNGYIFTQLFNIQTLLFFFHFFEDIIWLFCKFNVCCIVHLFCSFPVVNSNKIDI